MHVSEALQADIQEIKHGLPIPFVMHQLGWEPQGEVAGRFVYHNPFRKDDNPSFDVWYDEDKGWRWGDYAWDGGKWGDVLDLIGLDEYNNDVGDQLEAARNYFGRYVEAGEPTYTKVKKEKFDPDSYLPPAPIPDYVASEVYEHKPALHRIPDYMDVKWDGEKVHYLVLDESGALIGLRYRWPDGTKRAAKGYDSKDLYAPVRVSAPFVLCEGETDTLAAAIAGYCAFGIFGAAQDPEKVRGTSVLYGSITIAFDNDEAGNAAADKWADYLTQQGCEVYRAHIPAGLDLADLPVTMIRRIIDDARPLVPDPDAMSKDHIGYGYPQGKSWRRVCNWTLDVDKRLVPGPDEEKVTGGFQGVLNGKVVNLMDHDLSSQRNMVSWSSEHGVSWLGTGVDHQRLKAQLEYEAQGLPVMYVTSTVGRQGHVFVTPTDVYGEGDWGYIPSVRGLDVHTPFEQAELLKTIDQEWMADAFEDVRQWYSTDVMDPILAWLMAALHRPLFDRFPTLSVNGGSGTGKTTLIQAVIERVLGPVLTVNLTGTTRYGIESYFDVSNAYPIWFDEYRPGARDDARMTLEQSVRDGYTGQRSAKGGMSDNASKVVQVRSDVPVIVSGEQSFTEVSLQDRSVIVRLTKIKQGFITRSDRTMGPRVLSWTTDTYPDGKVWVEPFGPKHLKDRLRYNLGVLNWGWAAWQEMLMDLCGYDLSAPDWSGVMANAEEVSDTSSIKDLVEAAWAADYCDALIEADDKIWVHPSGLLSWAEKNRIATHLGTTNVKDVKRQLEEDMGGVASRVHHNGKYIRVVEIDREVVE